MIKDPFAQLILRSTEPNQLARTNMLKQQIRAWDVFNDKILALFYVVPREEFVPPAYKSLAFADIAIPLSHGQAMMTPKEEGRVLQELTIAKEDKILVLGMDSGFLLVLLSLLAGQVIYVDSHLDAQSEIKNKLAKFEVTNVTCLDGSLQQGWQDLAPFDVMILTGSAPFIPEHLKHALKLHGRLYVVIGHLPVMEATIITRSAEEAWTERKLFETERPRLSEVEDTHTFEF
jgi:protein-L-isoaspartate(D-aspartate) O-methyltransferase